MERRSERIFGQRYGCRPVNIADLNMHLMCVLCGGYYIDATTIIECLHSFCRSCIVRYLESSSRCPVCDVLVHKAQPLLNIRMDHVLQGLVYKLVPGLLTKEMNSRREFYSRGLTRRTLGRPEEECDETTRSVSTSEEPQQRPIKTPNQALADSESLSISLEYLQSSKVTESKVSSSDAESRAISSATDVIGLSLNEYSDVRYLLCPAGFTMGGLKKFIRAKFDLPLVYQIEIFHNDERLENHFSMLDVAFIFQWQKKSPLNLRYSVTYAPRTKRKLTTSDSTGQQDSKENEALQGRLDKNGENTTSHQQELTKLHSSVCLSKAAKHANSKTGPFADRKKSTFSKGNGATRFASGVFDQKDRPAVSSHGNGSGYGAIEEGKEEDKPREDMNASSNRIRTEDERTLNGSNSKEKPVSRDTMKINAKSDGAITNVQVLETQCTPGKRTPKITDGEAPHTTPVAKTAEIVVDGTCDNPELTIDLTGEDLNSPATAAGKVDEARSGGDIPKVFGPESISRVVGSVAFVGDGTAAVVGHRESVLCSVGQIPVNGDITKQAIALPCIGAFKTLSCGMRSHFSYASDGCSQVASESVVTDDVVKIISTPEGTIVPSFGVQLIYSPDSVVSQNPICGVIQLPETPIGVTSDALTRAPMWSQNDVATNGIMNDVDFLRLCEGRAIHAEKGFSSCYEHFVMPNFMESVGAKMPDEVALSYAMPLDSASSRPVPCVFVAQATTHQPQNSWSLPESCKEAEAVDWGLCYPVTAAELGTASVASISDERCLQQQAEEDSLFIGLTSDTRPCSAAKSSVHELWSLESSAGSIGTVETQTVESTGVDSWTVEPRAVRTCRVEPQAVKRKAENDWAVEPKEAKTSSADSNMAKALQVEHSAVEYGTGENTTVEPQVVEPKSVVRRTVEPEAVENGTTRQHSVETEATVSCSTEARPERSEVEETQPTQSMVMKQTLMEPKPEEPKAAENVTAELQARQSYPDTWAPDTNLLEPGDAEPTTVNSCTVELKSATVTSRITGTQSNNDDGTNILVLDSLSAANSFLPAVSEDLSGVREDHLEESAMPQLNEIIKASAVEAISAISESAIRRNDAVQLSELQVEEKFLVSGESLADICDVSCAQEQNEPNKGLDPYPFQPTENSSAAKDRQCPLQPCVPDELFCVRPEQCLSLSSSESRPEHHATPNSVAVEKNTKLCAESSEDLRCTAEDDANVLQSDNTSNVAPFVSEHDTVELSADDVKDPRSQKFETLSCQHGTIPNPSLDRTNLFATSTEICREDRSQALLVETPSGAVKTLQTPSSAEKALQMPSGAEKALQMPSGAVKEALQTPSGAEKALQMPSGAVKEALQTPSGAEKALQMPSGAVKTLQTPSSAEKALQMPSGAVKEALQTPSGAEKALQMPSGAVKEALQTPSGVEKALQMPSGAVKTLQTPSSAEKALQMPSGAGKALQMPSGAVKEALQTPSGAEKALQTPSGAEKALQTPSGAEKALQTPSGAEKALQTPSSAEKALHMPSGAGKALQMPSGAVKEARQTPSGAEKALQMPSGAVKEALQTPSGAEKALQTPSGAEKALQMPSGAEKALQMPSGAVKEALQTLSGAEKELSSCSLSPETPPIPFDTSSPQFSTSGFGSVVTSTITMQDISVSSLVVAETVPKVDSVLQYDSSVINLESPPGLEVVDDGTVVLETENSFVSSNSEALLSVENETASTLTKLEDFANEVEGDSAPHHEEERFTINMVEKEMDFAENEDILASGIVDCIEEAADSRNELDFHASDSMQLPPASESMPGSSMMTELPICASFLGMSVPYSAANHSPASVVDTTVLLAEDGMMVSVTDDHVIVCIDDEEPVSVALEGNEEDAVHCGTSAKEIPVSNYDSGVPVSESSNEIPVVDSCNRISASDDCNETTISETGNEIPVSFTTLNIPVPLSTDHVVVSNTEPTDPCVPKDMPVPMLCDDIQVSVDAKDDEFSDLPENVPVVMAETKLAISSANELPVSVPVPFVQDCLPVRHSVAMEDEPVSHTSSLEVVPFCSSSVETQPFLLNVQSQRATSHAMSPVTSGNSEYDAQYVVVTNLMTGSNDEEDLSHYSSACDCDNLEDTLALQEKPASDIKPIVAGKTSIGGNFADKNSKRLEFDNSCSVVDNLVANEGMISSFSIVLGESAALLRSEQNSRLSDTEDPGEDRVPGCGSKIIDPPAVTENDQKSLENRVNFLPSDNGLEPFFEKRNEANEKDDLGLSERLRCSGSFVRKDEKYDDYFQSTAQILCSNSFSNTLHGSLDCVFQPESPKMQSFMSRSVDCAMPSGSAKRQRSRSLDDSTKLCRGELESTKLQSGVARCVDDGSLKVTMLLSRKRDKVGCFNRTVCDEKSVPEELTVLTPSESSSDRVPVLSYRNQISPFLTSVQDDADAVGITPVNNVISGSDDCIDTCKFAAPDSIQLSDACCDNTKLNDGVTEKNTGDIELNDEHHTH